jgi:hypothetical protein
MKNKTLRRILFLPLVPLALPLTAMALGAEGWAWSAGDFAAAWLMMAVLGFAYVWIAGKTPSATYRFATGLALLTAFLLLWINGAVGMIGDEDNPANLLYGGVLLVGLAGAAIVRLRPGGMARVLSAMALAQLLVPALALLVRRHDLAPGVWQVFAPNAGFAALFLGSAYLFRRAAGPAQPSPGAAA